jgi:hypothetical protein
MPGRARRNGVNGGRDHAGHRPGARQCGCRKPDPAHQCKVAAFPYFQDGHAAVSHRRKLGSLEVNPLRRPVQLWAEGGFARIHRGSVRNGLGDYRFSGLQRTREAGFHVFLWTVIGDGTKTRGQTAGSQVVPGTVLKAGSGKPATTDQHVIPLGGWVLKNVGRGVADVT